jgi:hypothetical protein|nr:MAG TPA_asm: tail fiber protein [Caudoviricetes sp.]
MANKQLPEFLTAENDLDGNEPVYIAQGGKTRKTLLSKIKEFIIGTTALTTTDKTITGAIEEVKGIVDVNSTSLNDLANPSLLINGDFRNPVNQRRKSSYNVNGEYTIDRWRFINDNNGTMTINDGYISISNGVANNTYLQYNYDTDMKVLEGEKVTFTIVYKSTATYRLSSFIGSAEEDVNIYLTPIDDWTVKTLTLDLSSWKYSIGKVESSIILQSYDGSSFTNGTLDVKYVKLELGSKATPFIPRLYGEELALCQRYYISDSFSFRESVPTTTVWDKFIPIRPYMRIVPTINASMYNTNDQNTLLDNIKFSVYRGNNLNFWSNETMLEAGVQYSVYYSLDSEIY